MAKKLTTKDFQIKLDEKHNGDITCLGNYINNNTKVLVKCNICNHEWNVLPMQLTRKKPTKCPKCVNNNFLKTTEEFRKEIKELVGEEYTLESDYQTNKIKVEFKHHKCGNKFKSTPKDFLKGHRCPFCSHKSTKYSLEEFKGFLNDISGEEYTLESDYTGQYKDVTIKHTKCNKLFNIKGKNIINGYCKCIYCYENKSEGVLKIIKFFNKYNLDFKTEVTFKDLKYKNNLRFDFYIDSLQLFIEFDGRQHFIANDLMGGQEGLLLTQKRDKIKNKYCIDKKYTLLRIDQSNLKNINKILNEFINDRETFINNNSYNVYLINEGKLELDNNKYIV